MEKSQAPGSGLTFDILGGSTVCATRLWTLKTGDVNGSEGEGDEEDSSGDEEGGGKKTAVAGFVLEFDAARKIAQGLGAHLEKLSTIVEVKGDTAHLLPVSERTRFLFGKDETQSPSPKRKKKDPQLKLGFVKEIEEIETKDGWGTKSSPKAGSTVLDRLHQSMILCAAGRSEALKRFLVEEGAGNDQRFWRLAQALSALYPKSSDEKRWVDGVLARKKRIRVLMGYFVIIPLDQEIRRDYVNSFKDRHAGDRIFSGAKRDVVESLHFFFFRLA